MTVADIRGAFLPKGQSLVGGDFIQGTAADRRGFLPSVSYW